MRAMILAAGLGKRMQPLTSTTPKPLLRVGDHYLIEFAIARLVNAGITDIIVNVSYLAEQIKTTLGNGKNYGANIIYSVEQERLETGGGILNALPLLGGDPFLVMSSDIITDFPLSTLKIHPPGLAHLVLIDNPEFHPQGDFGLRDGFADTHAQPKYTFANIGVYRPEFFSGKEVSYFPLSELLFPAIAKKLVTAQHYSGSWFNIGTPKDLQLINSRAREDSNLRPLASETNTLSN